jgi:hypothetical protein
MFEKERRKTVTAKTKTKRKTKIKKGEPTLVGSHLVVDPRVCHGKLTFRGLVVANQQTQRGALPWAGLVAHFQCFCTAPG